jgi:hypothetical protein
MLPRLCDGSATAMRHDQRSTMLRRDQRNSSRSPSARDGHRFESPPLHQEVGANRPRFPVPTSCPVVAFPPGFPIHAAAQFEIHRRSKIRHPRALGPFLRAWSGSLTRHHQRPHPAAHACPSEPHASATDFVSVWMLSRQLNVCRLKSTPTDTPSSGLLGVR